MIAAAVAALATTMASLVAPGHAASVPSTRWQGTFSAQMTLPAGSDAAGSWPMRHFYVYVPPELPPSRSRSLVVYLHGTTQTAIDAANAVPWNDLADTDKFLVAYPEEATPAESGSLTDGSNPERAWSWGQPLAEGRGSGEVRTIAEITRQVTATYGVNPGRVYIGGASAGAIMATVMGASYPELYSAVGSWAGCNYLCIDPTGVLGYQRMGTSARVVPSILFAGTLDYIVNPALTSTQITGLLGMDDLADDGLPNGSVSPVPTAGPTTYGATLGALLPGPHPDVTTNGCHFANASNNPCPAGWLDWSAYPYTVTDFGYRSRPSDVVVESWIIHGLSHNYSGGNPEGTYVDPTGPDTTGPAWRFFDAHRRS